MKFVGSLTAREASLADGTPLIAEEEYDLSPDERAVPHNARLIAEGQLLAVNNNTDKAREEAMAFATMQTPADPPPDLPTPPEPGGS